MATPPDPREGRVLILAKFAGDSALTKRVLTSASIASEVCPDVESMFRAIDEGAGALFLAEEVLSRETIERLLNVLDAAPPWSDLPVLISGDSSGMTHSWGQEGVLPSRANVTFLDRPIHLRTMVSAVKGALRARARQFQARGFIAQLATAREVAEANDRSKDEFLATISHELRTPLNAILGWARMLTRGQLDADRQSRAMATIERNALAQAHLIEDLLDVSRIISGKIHLDVQKIDLVPIAEAAVDVVRPAMDAKQIRFVSVIDPSVGPVLGDPQRLQQVFWNLLANASKFTKRGGRVELSIQRVESSLEVSVRDDGEGIRADVLPHVFDRFKQGDGSISRVHGGLGLGLAIARHLVELHGGTVSAESDGPGQGATFRVRLPVPTLRSEKKRGEPSADASPSVRPAPQFDCPRELMGLRVLLLDDEADTLDLLSTVLQDCGSLVTTASTAESALRLLENATFDVLVSDIGLRGEDGYTFMAKVRALPAPNNTIAAAALTAYARAEDRQRSLRAGFQMHVAKPIEPAELVAVVANLARIALK